jgi:hypothetical protein
MLFLIKTMIDPHVIDRKVLEKILFADTLSQARDDESPLEEREGER